MRRDYLSMCSWNYRSLRWVVAVQEKAQVRSRVGVKEEKNDDGCPPELGSQPLTVGLL